MHNSNLATYAPVKCRRSVADDVITTVHGFDVADLGRTPTVCTAQVWSSNSEGKAAGENDALLGLRHVVAVCSMPCCRTIAR